ncbi:MAG: M48 family metalloprotease [Aquiluna sp.]
MEFSLYLLIALIELVMLVTVSAPMFFAGRFRKTPNLGMFFWFASLIASMVASVVAIGIAIYFVFQTYSSLQSGDNPFFLVAISFAPWLLLALAGILLALANQRLSPLFEVSPELGSLDDLGARYVRDYRSAQVLELEVPGYFALTRNNKIYLSSASFNLPERQLEAVLRHEYGHIKLRHQLLKKLAYLIYQLLPWVVASRALKREVDVLCELAADKYALRKVYSKDLYTARRLFL